MKWKITRRFLSALLATIVIALICFYLFITYIFLEQPEKMEEFHNPADAARNFTLDFGKEIIWRNGQLDVSQQGLKKLREADLWIQVLDENGDEVYNRFKPEDAPTHYSPAKLIFYYRTSGSIKRSTIFVSLTERKGRQFSYILGFPRDELVKEIFGYNPQTIGRDILRLLMGTFVAIAIVAGLIGYLFSSRLANPIVKLVGGIKELARGDYSNYYYEKGLYEDVFFNLNNLAGILRCNAKERRRTEYVREEWIANITHDIKTPLASIQGYSEVLLEPDYELSQEEKRQYASIIQDKANYIGKLVEDLKITYQLKHSLIPLKKEKVNLVDILRETIIDILNNPEHQNINLNFDPDNEVVSFQGNKILLKRAFSNLIYNAVIHNPSGTRIDVRIDVDDGIKIEIEDDGRGIDESEVEKLFQRYYRGTDTKKSDKGSGLGMAIAKQIIERHGGIIEVESEEGMILFIMFS